MHTPVSDFPSIFTKIDIPWNRPTFPIFSPEKDFFDFHPRQFQLLFPLYFYKFLPVYVKSTCISHVFCVFRFPLL